MKSGKIIALILFSFLVVFSALARTVAEKYPSLYNNEWEKKLKLTAYQQEQIKKIHTIDRLSKNLALDLNEKIDNNYLDIVMNTFGDNPIFVVDNSDIIKPKGNKFEDLGLIVDGSSEKKNIEKGYQVCEIVGLTEKEKQPISVYSKIKGKKSKRNICK